MSRSLEGDISGSKHASIISPVQHFCSTSASLSLGADKNFHTFQVMWTVHLI